MNKAKALLKRRVTTPLLGLLKQGITPQKLALTVTFGAMLGLFPIIGTTTYLCIFAALALRLNHAGIQIINYFVYPVQIILLIPFIKIGQWVFGAKAIPFNLGELIAMFQVGFWDTIRQLWSVLLLGVVGWGLFALPMGAITYFLALSAFRKALPNENTT